MEKMTTALTMNTLRSQPPSKSWVGHPLISIHSSEIPINVCCSSFIDVPDGREDEVDGLPLFLAKLKASLWKTITIQLKSQGNGVESYIFGGSSETKNCHICYKSGELIVHRGECPDPECQGEY